MATYFRTTAVTNIGTSPVTLLAPPLTSVYTLIGCNISNKTDYDVIITVTVTDTTPTTANYINGLVIPPYTSAKLINNGEKLIIQGNATLGIVSDTANSVDVTMSYAEIV
jgi:hypothetical protein